MTSRERVLDSLAKRPTDRVPRLLYEEVIGYTPPVERLLLDHCGGARPLDYFGMDITRVGFAPTVLDRGRFEDWHGRAGADAIASGEVDEWGVRWRTGGFHHFAHIESPLRDVEGFDRIRGYPWPDLDQPYRYEGLERQVSALHDRGLAVAAYAGSVFEQSWYLRGMDQLMMDMLEEPATAHYLIERTAEFQRFAAARFAAAGVDILITGDDIAGQDGPLMRLETWREFLKPRLADTVAAAKSANPACKVFYHSDGNVEPFIAELIDVGIDILNPLQPECVDPAAIKARYGDRLSFWGSVSVQRTMPFGSPDEVRAEVRARVQTVGKGGGFILAPAHVLGPEVPWENIVAFFEAADSTPVPAWD